MTLEQKRLEAGTWNGGSLSAAQLLLQAPSNEAPGRLCGVVKKRILPQGEESKNWRGPYLPNQDDLSELGP